MSTEKPGAWARKPIGPNDAETRLRRVILALADKGRRNLRDNLTSCGTFEAHHALAIAAAGCVVLAQLDNDHGSPADLGADALFSAYCASAGLCNRCFRILGKRGWCKPCNCSNSPDDSIPF